MDAADVIEWSNLLLRWSHIFAAILWVGSTYYFTWLDHTLHAEGQVWMVHSGGFYTVDKQTTPELLPKKLHWFRYESLATWVTGFLLMSLVYYHNRAAMVPLEGAVMSHRAAVAFAIAFLLLAWAVYDLLWAKVFEKNETVGVVVSFLLALGAAYGLSRVLVPRAVFLHMGAMFGTLMTANVWMRILPAQKRTLAALREGKPITDELRARAARAKLRSKQNTYMVLPVVFLMISHHYTIIGSQNNLLILGAMILLGWGAAKFLRH